MSAHAFMSPSAFKTAKNCPAAPLRQFQVNQRIDLLRLSGAHFYGLDEPSDVEHWDLIMAEDNNAADDGTKLHNVFEQCLNDGITSKDDIREMIKEQDLKTDMKGDEYILDQLTRCVGEQLELMESASRIGVEQRIKVLGLPQFGTIDLTWIEERTLYLRDLKTGRIEVESEENDQLMNYGVGIMDSWDAWDDVDEIKIKILGLRFEADEWTCKTSDLLDYKVNVMLPVFMAAYEINPEAKAGDHCLYCSAKIHCPEWNAKFRDTMINEAFENNFLKSDPDKLEDVWIMCKQAERLGKDIGRELMQRTQGFYEPQRVKIQKGNKRKSYAEGVDIDETMKKAGIKKSQYQKTEVLTPSQLDAKLGEDVPEGLITVAHNAPYLKMK